LDAWQVATNAEKQTRFQSDGVSEGGCNTDGECSFTSRAYSYRDEKGNDPVTDNNLLSITSEYSGEEEEFKKACEELWACR
jgi:hypothetical protein